jgi:hypothetical protein
MNKLSGSLYICVDCRASDAEDLLLKTLFTNYNELSRPVRRHADILTVSLGITVRQNIDIVSSLVLV